MFRPFSGESTFSIATAGARGVLQVAEMACDRQWILERSRASRHVAWWTEWPHALAVDAHHLHALRSDIFHSIATKRRARGPTGNRSSEENRMTQAPFHARSVTALADLCINTLRFLSVDAVQKVNSGHP